MKLNDKHALKRWNETIDPQTGYSHLPVKALAAELSVCETTVWAITRRLQQQGFIKKHHTHGPPAIEVLCLPSTITANT
jgi:hypothetical protein